MNKGHCFSTRLAGTRPKEFLAAPAHVILVMGLVLLGARPFTALHETTVGDEAKRLLQTADRPHPESRMHVAVSDRTAVAAYFVQPQISVTKTDAIVADDGNGIADPGETIRYTNVVTNSGVVIANDVVFTDTIDSNTTLVTGSLSTTPLARNDSYLSIGNVGITVPATMGTLFNDSDPDGDSVTLTAVQGLPANVGVPTTTANSGTVVMQVDGGFIYLPPLGFEGIDTFTYTVEDDDSNPDPATVFVQVTGMVWFIDNSASSTGDGRLNTPFNTLAAFEAVNGNGGGTDPEAGDCIFLYETASGDYTGGVTLLNSQILVGQGATASLESLCGITPPPNSNPLPTTGGTRPTITNSGGDGIILASGNTIRGLNVGNSSGFGIDGTAVGSLTISEVAVNNAAGGGFRTSTGGTLGVTLDELTSSNSSAEGILLSSVAGSFSVTGNTSITSPTAEGIEIIGSSGTFSFSGSTKTISTGSSDGISLTSNTGATFNFTGGGLNISTTTGDGFVATGGGTVNVTGTGNTINKTGGGGNTGITITTPTDIGSAGVTFESLSVASGSANGIVLNSTNGSFSVTGTGTGCAQTAGSCTGGSILSTTGDAISLTDADNVNINSMLLQNVGGDGIESVGGSNHAFSDVTIDTPAGNGWIGTNLGGTNKFDQGGLVTSVNTTGTSGISITNNNTNMTLLLIEDGQFTNSLTSDNMVEVRQSGTSVMRTEVFGNTFTNLLPQALALTTGQLGASTGTHTAIVGQTGASEGNTFQNANGTLGGNSLECVATNGGKLECKVQNNLFDNVAKNGALGNSSVLRTQTNGGVFVGEIRDNTLRNFNFGIGGRHGIGHVNEPVVSATSSTSLIINGNTIDDLTDREAIFLAFRAGSDGGDVTVSNNNIGSTGNIGGGGGLSDQEAVDFESSDDAAAVRLLIENNSIRANNGSDEVVFVEAKDNSSVHATIRNNTDITNVGGTGNEIEVEAEGAGSSVCANIAGNTLNLGAGTIDLDGGAGTLNVTQSSAADVASANSIPVGNVIVSGGGVDAFNVTCPLPTHSSITANIQPDPSASAVKYARLDPANGHPDLTTDNVELQAIPEAYAPILLASDDPGSNAIAIRSQRIRDGLADEAVSDEQRASAFGPTQRSAYLESFGAHSGVESTSLVTGRSAGAAGQGYLLSGETVSFTIGTMDPGQILTITFDVTVDNPLPTGVAEVCNQSTVAGSNFATVVSDDPDVAGAADPTCTPTLEGADLTLTKDDGDVSVMPGDVLSYTITYENVGGQDASGVEITDVVPANTTFNATTSTSGWSCSDADPAGTTCSFNVGAVNAGDPSASVTFAVNVVNPVPAGTEQISNTASIDDDGTGGVDPNPGNNTDSDTTPVIASPIIAVTKVDVFQDDGNMDGFPDPGEKIEYTVVITNNGDEDAENVIFDDDGTDHPNTTLFDGSVTTTQGTVTSGNGGGPDTDVSVDIGMLAGGGGSATITFVVTIDSPVPTGVTRVCNQGTVSDNFPDVLTDDPDDLTSASDSTCTTVVANQAPVITDISPASTTVQYSDVVTVVITATDDDKPDASSDLTISSTWTDDGGTTTNPGLPSDLSFSAASCGPGTTTDRQCTWTLSGQMQRPASTIEIEVVISDGALPSIPADTVNIEVDPEDVIIVFDNDNPVAVEVENPGDPGSGVFDIKFDLSEFDDPNDVPGDANRAGDITKASIVTDDTPPVPTVSLVPVGPGSAQTSTGCSEVPVTGLADPDSPYDYDKRRVTCFFDGVPVNTYEIVVVVNRDGFYEGVGEDVLTVFDASLGFTTGGGTFYWPGTADGDYPGDRTNFGFNVQPGKKKASKGSFIANRKMADGTNARVKSNAMNGLAIGEAANTHTFGWATFDGKATYKSFSDLEPIGNHNFIVYVEDHGTPGGDADRIWLRVTKDGVVQPDLSLDPPAPDNAVVIKGGNIVVPHTNEGKNRKFGEEVPDEFALHPNYPNPFNPVTTITLDVPEESEVSVRVYDILGRLVSVLVDGTRAPGVHRIVFDAEAMPSGVYVVLAETPVGQFTRTMLLVK